MLLGQPKPPSKEAQFADHIRQLLKVEVDRMGLQDSFRRATGPDGMAGAHQILRDYASLSVQGDVADVWHSFTDYMRKDVQHLTGPHPRDGMKRMVIYSGWVLQNFERVAGLSIPPTAPHYPAKAWEMGTLTEPQNYMAYLQHSLIPAIRDHLDATGPPAAPSLAQELADMERRLLDARAPGVEIFLPIPKNVWMSPRCKG